MKLLQWTWLLLVLGSAQVDADTLRWQWVAGDVYEIKLRSTTDIAVTAEDQELIYKNEIVVIGQWTVVELSSAGVARLNWQVSRVQVNPQAKKDDQLIMVDTEVVAETQQQKTLQATLQGLLQKRFELLVNNTARLIEIKEFRQNSAASGNTPPGNPVDSKKVRLPQVFNSQGVARAFKHVFVQFPSTVVNVGDAWRPTQQLNTSGSGDMTVYRYLGSDGQKPQIKFSSNIQFSDPDQPQIDVKTKQQQGSIFINVAERFVEKVVVKLELETVTNDDGQQIHVNHTESNVIELKKLLR